jgi:hypothetical protein
VTSSYVLSCVKKELVLNIHFVVFMMTKLKNITGRQPCKVVQIKLFQRMFLHDPDSDITRQPVCLSYETEHWCIWTTSQVGKPQNILMNWYWMLGDHVSIIRGWVDEWHNCPLYLYTTALGTWARMAGLCVYITNSWWSAQWFWSCYTQRSRYMDMTNRHILQPLLQNPPKRIPNVTNRNNKYE